MRSRTSTPRAPFEHHYALRYLTIASLYPLLIRRFMLDNFPNNTCAVPAGIESFIRHARVV